MSPNVNQQSRIDRRYLLNGLILLCVGTGASGCTIPLTSNADLSWSSLLKRDDFSTSGPAYDRVKRVGERVLVDNYDGAHTWQFGIMTSPDLIAYAVTGNILVVSQGVLDLCENDGQLAALLAHRAIALGILKSNARYAEVTLPLNDRRSSAAVDKFYSDADISAITNLALAGYDPRDGLIVWQHIFGFRGSMMSIASDSPSERRLAIMAKALRVLGYQI
jgi:hypothetical protein